MKVLSEFYQDHNIEGIKLSNSSKSSITQSNSSLPLAPLESFIYESSSEGIIKLA